MCRFVLLLFCLLTTVAEAQPPTTYVFQKDRFQYGSRPESIALYSPFFQTVEAVFAYEDGTSFYLETFNPVIIAYWMDVRLVCESGEASAEQRVQFSPFMTVQEQFLNDLEPYLDDTIFNEDDQVGCTGPCTLDVTPIDGLPCPRTFAFGVDCQGDGITIAVGTGDGAQYQANGFTHTYADPGYYSPWLDVETGVDEFGYPLIEHFEFPNWVEVQGADAHLEAQADRIEGYAPLAVGFHAVQSGVSALTWFFGDGEMAYESDPVHVYAQPGSYTAVLEGANGCDEPVGASPLEILVHALPVVADLRIEWLEGAPRLEWDPLPEASAYRIYRSETIPVPLDAAHRVATVVGTDWIGAPLEDGSGCYRVTAVLEP